MIIVQKYGGATLETPEKIKGVASRIAQLKKQNHQVVAVVSAMGSTTNQLIQLAKQVTPLPSLRELDMLLSTGERVSMSLVSMALNDLGHHAISLTGSQAGIMTDDSHINAMITDVKANRVVESLSNDKIVILAGFQGVNPVTKEITTLGRGGSDTTAVAMAAFLKADRCEILKDVPSVFTADPKLVPDAQPLGYLNYNILLEMTYWGAKVLHYRSVELAKVNKIKLYVGPAVDPTADGTYAPAGSHRPVQIIGTLIQEDTMFETTKPIAVNSHSSVLELEINKTSVAVALQKLAHIFKTKNIGMPQVLFGDETTKNTALFITAPSEVLEQIKEVAQSGNDFTLSNKKLCSVSLTCTGSSVNEVLIQASRELENNNIPVYKFTQSSMSLNFFLDVSLKESAIKVLHSLIK